MVTHRQLISRVDKALKDLKEIKSDLIYLEATNTPVNSRHLQKWGVVPKEKSKLLFGDPNHN